MRLPQISIAGRKVETSQELALVVSQPNSGRVNQCSACILNVSYPVLCLRVPSSIDRFWRTTMHRPHLIEQYRDCRKLYLSVANCICLGMRPPGTRHVHSLPRSGS